MLLTGRGKSRSLKQSKRVENVVSHRYLVETRWVVSQYFSRVQVKDHIHPIYWSPQKKQKVVLEEVEKTVEITKLLDELGYKSDKPRRTDDSDDDLLELPGFGESFEESGNESEPDSGDEDRGKFHHAITIVVRARKSWNGAVAYKHLCDLKL